MLQILFNKTWTDPRLFWDVHSEVNSLYHWFHTKNILAVICFLKDPVTFDLDIKFQQVRIFW